MGLIFIAIAYIIIIHLVKQGQIELAERAEKKKPDNVIEITNYTVTDIPQDSENKPLAFSYVDQDVPVETKKKGGFVSKELMRSYLSYQVDKGKK